MAEPMNTAELELNKLPAMNHEEVTAAAESLIEAPPQVETEKMPMNTPEVLEEAPTSNTRTVKPALASDPVARCRQLEEELSGMGHLCGELLSKYTAEQQTAAEAAQRGVDLEKQLGERELDLSKARAELERLTIEGSRLGAENRTLQEAKETAEKNIAAAAEAKPAPNDMAALQQRFDEAAAARSRLNADLERERAERRRLEQRATSLAAQLQEMHSRTGQHLEAERLSQDRISALEQQLREREDALARATTDLEKESAEHHSAEEQLRVAGDLIAQLKNSLASFDGAKKAMQRRHEELEKQLQASVSAATDNEARADKESRERERLEKALIAAERAGQQQAAELSRLQCALEVEQAERKQLEGEAVQLRYSSADSARTGLTTLNRLRSETRQPVSQLMHATRQLLEMELPENTKTLITSVLDNALLLQDTLHEIGGSKSASPTAESTVQTAASQPASEPES
jgi:chromosome segregation ATPase